MRSLAYSVALCKPTKKHTTITSSCSSSSSLHVRNHSEPQERVASLGITSDEKQQRLVVGRREALLATATGLLVGVGGAGLAAAAEDASCEFTIAPNGLAFCDKLVGIGPQPSQGQLIKAHYIGRLEDGTVFDSSYNRGKPLTFRVGVGEVIKGWDQGILGTEGIPPMLAGGKRRLKIPPELGYGVRGAGCRGGSCIIPPNSVLLFDVEFVGKA